MSDNLNKRYSTQVLVGLMQQHWSEACTPAHELITGLFRLRDILLVTDIPVIKRHGLSLMEFDVLATLRKMPFPHEATPTELLKAIVITSGGLTKVLSQLKTKHMITLSTVVSDKRSKLAQLTETGTQCVEDAMGELLGSNERLLAEALEAMEVKKLNGLLQKLLCSIESK